MDELPPRLPVATRDTRANLVRAFKASGCAECKRRYPELDWSDLHIDHIDPRDKPRSSMLPTVGGNPGSGYRLPRSAAESLLAELLLCQVLCADCHKAKHRNGNGNGNRQLSLFNGTGTWTPTGVNE